jgi:hypothetical protein
MSESHVPAVASIPKVSAAEAWAKFERALAKAIGELNGDEFLVICSKHDNRFVQFAGQGPFGMRAEAVSNAYLDAQERLSAMASDALIRLGWQPPTYVPEDESDNPVDGSPNFFLDIAPPVPWDRLAALAVVTLRDVFGIGHPGLIAYDAFAEGGEPIRIEYLPISSADQQVM